MMITTIDKKMSCVQFRLDQGINFPYVNKRVLWGWRVFELFQTMIDDLMLYCMWHLGAFSFYIILYFATKY